MYKLIIKRADESVYWTEQFNSEEKLQAWLAEEQTRSYWDPMFEAEVEHVVPEIASAPSAWDIVRSMRNELLSACDWTQLVDSPLDSEDKQLWRVYRQALRDLPEQSGDPENLVWPEQPE